MALGFSALLFLESTLVIEEVLVVRDEDLGFDLNQVHVRKGRLWARVILTSRGSVFHERPGQDWITSLHALKIYSLLMTILKVGSVFPSLGMVRTILWW
mgnify:CR=1 FL=1